MTEGNRQLLPKETYYSEDWYEREKRELFDQSWSFACLENDVAQPGDFHTLRFMDHALFVVRGEDKELRAFHNICRHRCSEVLEGSGNTGTTMMCPYHRWTYDLDGNLRGVPNESECFGDRIDRETMKLRPASVGVYRGIVFVNPSPAPRDDFKSWIANMDDHGWPHRFDDGSLEYVGETVYEMHCNWKVFYENAIDGYHLGYLHDQTLGKVYPSKNLWELVGRNHVWYSTEREGAPQASTILTTETMRELQVPLVDGQNEASFYPGVVMLFPLTILSPNPRGFNVSMLEPAGPNLTYMRSHGWAPPGSRGRFGSADSSEPIRLVDLDKHPLETGNFQLEDMWIVEKVQRNLRSPNYQVGPLADGDGAENPLVEFQEQVLEFVPGS